MQTKTKVLSLSALVLAAVVFGMILAGSLDFTRAAAADPSAAAAAPAVASASARPAVAGLPSFADIAERVMPAVVSIRSTDIIKPSQRKGGMERFFGEGTPFHPFGPDRQQRGDQEEEQQQQSGGTGFLIEASGFVLTNNHVIDGAEKVEVTVGETDVYKAKVVGRDPATDLALLKIEGAKPFPTLAIGDSDRIRVGEWVMAIGDPLQFEKTVTVGVVSGKGRAPGLSNVTRSFENLIQTDAAINFGNSGGPLVNVAGEVVGINTAISRMAQNIGFAVPINVAKNLVPQLKEGKVVRGFLGIQIGPIEADVQESLGLKSRDGALVQSVEKGMPADKAGIRHEDVIIRVDQAPVKHNRDLIDYVSGKRPGTKVTLTFIRGGQEKTTVATLETRREEGEAPEPEPASDENREKIGISIDDLSPAFRNSYSIGKDIEGVVLTHVKPVSAAGDAGLREGDVVQEVNGTAVSNVAGFRAELKKAGDARFARFYVHRPGPRPANFIAAVRLKD
ncbi:MAG: Do family serine endopeptidase [Holophagales bacterium]|nr:Do family serine endopeptidase [Holophagales bacterium]